MHQDDSLGVSEMHLGQFSQATGVVNRLFALGHLDFAPSNHRGTHHEQGADPVAFILIVTGRGRCGVGIERAGVQLFLLRPGPRIGTGSGLRRTHLASVPRSGATGNWDHHPDASDSFPAATHRLDLATRGSGITRRLAGLGFTLSNWEQTLLQKTDAHLRLNRCSAPTFHRS